MTGFILWLFLMWVWFCPEDVGKTLSKIEQGYLKYKKSQEVEATNGR